MKPWRWLEAADLVAMQRQVIAEFGGRSGLRDQALLESAAARPKHLAAYGPASLFELAAAYAFGLARNHPFIDGNKRISLIAAFTFLALNGWQVQAEETATVLVFLDLAAGKLDEKQLARWLEGNSGRLQEGVDSLSPWGLQARLDQNVKACVNGCITASRQ